MRILRALHIGAISLTGAAAVYCTLGGYLMRPRGYADVNMSDGAWWLAACGAGWALVTAVLCAHRCTPLRRYLLLGCIVVWALAVGRMMWVGTHYAQFTPDQEWRAA